MKVNNESEFKIAINSKSYDIEIVESFTLSKNYLINFNTKIWSQNNILLKKDRNFLNSLFNIQNSNVTFQNLTFTCENDIINNYSFIISNGNITINKITFNNINCKEQGSVVNNNGVGSLKIINESKFINCSSKKNGGVIYSSSSNSIEIENTLFEQNKGINGGVIYLENTSNCIIKSSDFTNNIAYSNGGSIYSSIKPYNINITNTNFINGKSNGNGGAIYSNSSIKTNILLLNNIFEKNTGLEGGALYINSPKSCNISNNKFIENKATNGGGCAFRGTTLFNLTSNDFIKNKGDASGAIDIAQNLEGFASIHIKKCIFKENFSPYYGGALSCKNTEANIYETNFTSNKADDGAGIYSNSKGSLNILASVFNQNNSINGSGIYIKDNINCKINNSSFYNNNASKSGGAIFQEENKYLNSSLNINERNYFSNNKAISGKDIYNGSKLIINKFNSLDGGIYICNENNKLLIQNDLDDSRIPLENSSYLDPKKGNKSIIIASVIEPYKNFNDSDINSIIIPKIGFKNWKLLLSDDKKEMILRYMNSYNIIYSNTKDAINNNPNTYTSEDLPIILNPLEKDGFTFKGWLDEKENIITKINAGTIGNIDLYATWSQETYVKIEFEKNASGEQVDNMPIQIKVPSGSNIIIPNNIPLRDGYVFRNWNTLSDGSGENIYPGQEINKVIENKTLYAIWTTIPVITTTFNKNAKTEYVSNMPASIKVPSCSSIIIPDNIPFREGYIFLNWNTLSNGLGENIYPKQELNELVDDTILYAKWYKIPVIKVPQYKTYKCICCGCQCKISEICNCNNNNCC